jgi:hypothetical protein
MHQTPLAWYLGLNQVCTWTYTWGIQIHLHHQIISRGSHCSCHLSATGWLSWCYLLCSQPACKSHEFHSFLCLPITDFCPNNECTSGSRNNKNLQNSSQFLDGLPKRHQNICSQFQGCCSTMEVSNARTQGQSHHSTSQSPLGCMFWTLIGLNSSENQENLRNMSNNHRT